jgi:hypothetical protein
MGGPGVVATSLMHKHQSREDGDRLNAGVVRLDYTQPIVPTDRVHVAAARCSTMAARVLPNADFGSRSIPDGRLPRSSTACRTVQPAFPGGLNSWAQPVARSGKCRPDRPKDGARGDR